jgi:hypothetical protein
MSGFAFWHCPFELPDYNRSEEELARAFDTQLELLLRVPTRIHQKRGWLFWHFSLERQVDSAWRPVSGCAALRTGFKAVSIQGRVRTYYAGPISPPPRRVGVGGRGDT